MVTLSINCDEVMKGFKFVPSLYTNIKTVIMCLHMHVVVRWLLAFLRKTYSFVRLVRLSSVVFRTGR